MKLTLWHGSDGPISTFSSAGPDRALHLGTREQAAMRNGSCLHEVEIDVTRIRRSRDPGGNWSGRIRAARAAGADAIVYLNRYEGLSAQVIERLDRTGRLRDLDGLTDRDFRRLVPEASDSWIILAPEKARVVRVLDRRPQKSSAEDGEESDPAPL